MRTNHSFRNKKRIIGSGEKEVFKNFLGPGGINESISQKKENKEETVD